VTPAQLVAGQVYFEVCYEDEHLKRMYIQSYEYLGKEGPSVIEPGEKGYRFRPLNPVENGEVGEFEFTTKTLDLLHDLSDLIDHLARVQRNGPGRAFAPDAS
jgi:hypothetical protein